MKTAKNIHIALLAARLLLAGTVSIWAQPPQQERRPDAAAPAAPASAAQAPTAPPPRATHQAPPANSAGMVWVNTDSGVYHKPGTRWYGKTKQGK